MKVGLIYTSTTPELIELVEKEVKGQLGEDVELYSIEDPSILAETRDAGLCYTESSSQTDRNVHEGSRRGLRGNVKPVLICR